MVHKGVKFFAGFIFLMAIYGWGSGSASANMLKGQVTVSYGKTPAANVSVMATDAASKMVHYRTTDANGQFDFYPLPAGTYYLSYHHPSGTDMYVPGAKSIAGAKTYQILSGQEIVADFDLYAQLPELNIWPGPNELGQPSRVGNPTVLSFIIDNAFMDIADLDLRTFQVLFDGVDITSIFFQLPLNSFLITGSKVIITLNDITLPPGDHSISLSIGNNGQDVVSITRQISVQSSRGFQIGFHMPPVEDWDPPLNDWAQDLNRANETFERHHTLIGYFTSWAENNGDYTPFNSFLNDQITGLGAVPVITWEPWRAGGGPRQTDYTLDTIVQGNHDGFIKDFAADVKDHGTPVILRLMHEFNGVYYPWAGANNNNDPNKFIQAFRHIVSIFRNAGVTNAQFMWSPNYAADSRVPYPSNDIQAYYPGDAYVDWIGVSGYNWGSDKRMQGQGWLEFAEIFDGQQFNRFLSTMAATYPSKKVIIAEVGCNDDTFYSKADWITNAYSAMATYPNVGGVVWFNNSAFHDAAGLEADFRVIDNSEDTSRPDSRVMDAYKNAVKSEK